MSDSTFRTAVTEASPAEPTPISRGGDSVNTQIPELLATYEEDQGKPYSADYYELSQVWDKTDNLSQELKGIDKYLRELVESGKLDNNTKTAKKFLADLEKKAGIEQFDNTNKRISRLTAYIQFRRTVDA